MADRPAEQRFLCGEIGRDRLADIEAVDEEGALFVGSPETVATTAGLPPS